MGYEWETSWCVKTAVSASSTAKTASACPVTFTFSNTWVMTPSASITNVVRAIPKYFLPYIDFSTQTP